ncbi:coiled-coil domain-containing protein 122-like [Melanotaenia boesemani]|uniref:coiled-coil domain-containing protein 122-like n=1 Tax=Melanotaenia boesemani TaxID=1250792 RepID=UPI001C050C69|nr:coiled-coil domain-containing protein 122-like [Melanotaenia boesemani]
MSTFTDHRYEYQESNGLSLTKAVEDVSQHGYAQMKALKEKQRTFSILQEALVDVEKEGETSKQELRSKEREVLMLECEVEHLERQTKVLHDHCLSISKEITELQVLICEEEENTRLVVGRFVTYRRKMEDHRAAVLHAMSQTEAHKELERKKVMVQMLTQKRDQLREENPNGNTTRMAKREIDALKKDISERKTTIAERREQLRNECETHTQLKKDIEIQNRRHEAIIKRLRCQVSRAQAVHRETSDDVYHLQRQLAELKRRRESSQDSTVSDH